MRRVRAVVRGDVQGVGYRYTMRMVAREAGVTGWVRNRRDGTVEAEIEGADAQVDAVLAWMAEGPPGSRVTDSTVTDAAPGDDGSFEVRPDGGLAAVIRRTGEGCGRRSAGCARAADR